MHTTSPSAKMAESFWDPKERKAQQDRCPLLTASSPTATTSALLLNASVNAYRASTRTSKRPTRSKPRRRPRFHDPHPHRQRKSMRVEVRSVSPDSNPYLVMYHLQSGIDGNRENQKSSPGRALSPGQHLHRHRPFRKGRMDHQTPSARRQRPLRRSKARLADRCPRALGTFVKAPEVQYQHEVYTSSSGTLLELTFRWETEGRPLPMDGPFLISLLAYYASRDLCVNPCLPPPSNSDQTTDISILFLSPTHNPLLHRLHDSLKGSVPP